MKVALVINELNIRGGTHKQLHRLCEFLLSKEHSVTIFTKFYDPLKCYPGTELFKIISYDADYEKVNKMRGLKRLIHTLKLDRIMANDIANFANVVNIHDNGLEFVNFFLLLKWKKRLPIIWQINDLHPTFNVGNSKAVKFNKILLFYKNIIRFLAKRNTAITVNVSKNVQRVKQYLNCDAYLFHCGVDLRNAEFKFHEMRPNKITLMSTGVFFTYRNYETFLKVQAFLQNEYKLQVDSFIVGSTTLDETYATKIKNIIQTEKIDCNITGDITEDELLKIYRKADFFLFLNIDQSWGLSVFEAMNMCLPVIVSNSVGATELLENRKTALVVDPIDHEKIGELIYYYYSHSLLREELIQQSFSSSLSMSWDTMYSSKMLNLFNNIIQQ